MWSTFKERFRFKLPLVTLLLFSLLFIFFFYGKILKNPNAYIFNDGGDGIKNYFTYAYHIKHDSTYSNLEGMNYPFGENYLYTDCHPILANSFKYLASFSSFFSTNSIGILNFILISCIFLTFIVLYKISIKLKINEWISVIFAIGITLLAPQLFRLTGHLALSYSLAFPITWLLTIKCIQEGGKRNFILFTLNNCFWIFIHAYLGTIILSFTFSLWLVQVFSDKERKSKLLSYTGLLLAIILPFILFSSHLILTDVHTDRTNNPSGFFLYNAELDDVFIPSQVPFRPALDRLTSGVIKLEWEATGYVGMVNSLCFIALLLISITALFNRKAKSVLKIIFRNKFVNISLIASVIVLLFALAIPFKQFPELLDVFPLFKQFRATGRFVWPFYFVSTVFVAYGLNALLMERIEVKKTRLVAVIFLVFYISMQGLESYHYHAGVSKSITKSPNLFDENQLPSSLREALQKIKPENYQAILSIPFYYYGSESFARPRQDEVVRNSLILSFHTGIPTVNASLTRTSIEESKRIVQIVSPNYYAKSIVNALKSQKKFLIVKTGNDFTTYESSILNKSKPLFTKENVSLLEISTEDLFRDESKDRLNLFSGQFPNLIKQDSFLVTKKSSVLFYKDFETLRSDTSFRGKGSFATIKKGKHELSAFAPNTFEQGKEYELSMWMFNGEPDALNLWFRLIVEEYDEKNNIWHATTFFPEQAEVINGNWSLVEGVFQVNDSKNKVYIHTIGKEDSKAALHIDDILIKEKGVDVYKFEKDNSLFYNNHYIKIR